METTNRNRPDWRIAMAVAAAALLLGGQADAKSPSPPTKKVTTAVACASWGGAFGLAALPTGPIAALTALAGCATGVGVNNYAWDAGEEIGSWGAPPKPTTKPPPLVFDCRNFPKQAGCRH